MFSKSTTGFRLMFATHYRAKSLLDRTDLSWIGGVCDSHGGRIRGARQDLTACQHGIRIDFTGDGHQRKQEDDGYGFHDSKLDRQSG
jgi:hypothetical protein